KDYYKRSLSGISFAFSLIMTARFYHRFLFILCVLCCFTPWISAPIALVGGFLFNLLWGHPYERLNHKATGLLLKASVIGLGFGMTTQSAWDAGKNGFGLTVGSVIVVLLLGSLIGKWLSMPAKSSHLIASGTAICGGSAIAAVGPAVNASEKDISVSLGVIFLLNSIALIIFPSIGHLFDLSQHQFGLWSAIAIHDTSSVVGASSAYGEEALQVATTVKMARALWIIPVALVSALVFGGKGKKCKMPWFIFLFIFAIIANSYLPICQYVNGTIVEISKRALVVTLFLIGAGLSVDKMKSVGWKALILGVSLWIIISIASLFVILKAEL
ncbi:MAG: putative sulfate exporter family transporter, partial [Akkermansia sp.]